MARELRQIEIELEQRLIAGKNGITSGEGKHHFANYITARERLMEEILPEIKAIEKNLTDHSERHIEHVLDNIYALLGDDIKEIPTMELYFLCLLALFHDVGNIHGRTAHYDMAVIYQIYGYVRDNNSKFDDEKSLVAIVASKHSGKATDGSTDTIQELSQNIEGLWNKGIDLRKCAAILRFADELAEGRNRTSNFMIQYHKYDEGSLLYHRYASCTKPTFISKSDNRIALTYTIRIDSKDPSWDIEIKELLVYVYHRILKMDNERLYNKYYAEKILSAFKKIEVTLNFEIDNMPKPIGLKQLVINDLVIPGKEDINEIYRNDNAYNADVIIEKVKKLMTNGSTK